jgi:hypothetical protein
LNVFYHPIPVLTLPGVGDIRDFRSTRLANHLMAASAKGATFE